MRLDMEIKVMGTLKDLADALDTSKEIAQKVYKKANKEGRSFKEVLDEELEKVGVTTNHERK